MKNHTFITQRLPVEVGRAIEAAASAADVSVARFVLNAIVAALPEGLDLKPLPPSPPRRPIIIPRDDIAAVSSFGGHLGRLTGATIQMSRVCRETGRLSEHESIEGEIRDLRAAKAEVVAIVGRLLAAEAAAR
jgi:hypothetical protein